MRQPLRPLQRLRAWMRLQHGLRALSQVGTYFQGQNLGGMGMVGLLVQYALDQNEGMVEALRFPRDQQY